MIVETLRVFVAVAEQSNFSRAAEMLNLSQPGVSLHIRNLENEFGTKLMHRSPKQVKLTEAGELLYKRAKAILASYEAAKFDIQRLQDTVTGSLLIGASFTIGEYIVPRLFADFAEQYPQVEMSLTIGNTEEIIRAIRENRMDIGLVEGRVPTTDLLVTPFMRDELIIVAAAGHPLTRLPNTEPEFLHHQTWILRENGSGTRAFSDQFINENELHVKRSYVFNSGQGVKEAVAAGLGIALLSRRVAQRDLEAGYLIEIPLNDIHLERNFSWIRMKDSITTMAIDVFTQKLQGISRK
ncbi:LysR family transcriptional regulator [Paenibacillus agaridevorans]|uniref:LysR family transcriptional regulator n=1 Tax=Paenibacillus agaridevorans TaxID=171404 RepID=A0A2R5F2U7_9BACL|nr:LysR family transcriptional regulator [Paenibacillus agaridevorans]GBG10211.1 LysR family transcriptional regulator [Paenibacillus agaridevorans]